MKWNSIQPYKRMHVDICHRMQEPGQHEKWKNEHKSSCITCAHLCETSKIGKSTEIVDS